MNPEGASALLTDLYQLTMLQAYFDHAELMAAQAPIDGFGVRTRMNTAADAPFLDCAYKLVQYVGVARRKRSEGRATWPGEKQVWRRLDAQGVFAGDVLAWAHDPQQGEPLLQQVMAAGQRCVPAVPLEQSRAHARHQLAALPPALRALQTAPAYPVAISAGLQALAERLDARAA